MGENIYYNYFLNKIGRGGGEYYTGIGHIYKSKRGLQTGYGVFVPSGGFGRRRGLGIGTILSSIFRIASPILKSIGAPILKALGTTAVDTVAGAAKDGIAGMNMKDSIIKRGKEGVHEIVSAAPAAFRGIVARSNLYNDRLNSSTIPDTEDEEDGSIYQEPVRKKRRIIHNIKQKGKRRLGNKYPALRYF